MLCFAPCRSIVLLQRGGGCDYAVKLLHAVPAVAVAFYNREDMPLLDEHVGRLSVVSATPILSLAWQDGAILRDYLIGRRKCTAANGSDSCVGEWPVLHVSLRGVSTTAHDDRAALVMIADPSAGGLAIDDELVPTPGFAQWSALSDPAFDPCLQRLLGVHCEGGHVVSVQLTDLSFTGALHPAWGLLTRLRHLDVSRALDYALTGVVPDSFCALSELRTLILEENSIESLPDCLGTALTQLRVLRVASNYLSSLPASLASAPSLLVLSAGVNNLAAFPFHCLQPRLQVLELGINPLLNMDAANFAIPPVNASGLKQLQLTQCAITGEIAPAAFDGLASLQALDLSSNELTGSLPSFNGCPALQLLSLQRNHFTGGIPPAWAYLQELSTLYVQRNALNGSMRALVNLPRLTVLDVSHNLLALVSEDGGDVGRYISRMLPTSIVELYIDSNQLDGVWSAGYLSAYLRWSTITMSNNTLRSVPQDLFLSPLTRIDLSNNRLDGALQLHQSPRSVATSDGAPMGPVAFVDLHGNPSLYLASDRLGALLEPSDSAFVLDLSTHALCPVLQPLPSFPRLVVSLDAAFALYAQCTCGSGYFGLPPWCVAVPTDVSVRTPLGTQPTSASVQRQLAAIHATSQQFPPPLRDATSKYTDLVDLVGPTVANVSDGSFSDGWFARPTALVAPLVLSTTFHMELRSLRWDNESRSEKNGQPELDATEVAAEEAMQPVRSVTLQIYFSAADFGTSLLTISSAKSIIRTFSSADVALLPAPLSASTSPLWASSAAQVRVPGNQVDVLFRGPEHTQPRFSITYTYSYACDDELQLLRLSDGTTECVGAVQPTQFMLYQKEGLAQFEFECPAVSTAPTNPAAPARSLLYPAQTGYSGCRCLDGAFGVPPLCPRIPSSVRVMPFGVPESLDVNSTIPFNQLLLLSSSSVAAAAGTNLTLSSSNRWSQTAVSDEWFGSRRSRPGFSTNWFIDLRDMRMQQGTEMVHVGALRTNQTRIGSTDALQPVRRLTVHLHIDRARFSEAGQSLAVFESTPSSGNLLRLVDGSSSDSSLSPSVCSSYNLSTFGSAYHTRYGALLSSLSDPCLVVTTVASNAATIVFTSLERAGKAFVATYDFEFACPSADAPLMQDGAGNWGCATPPTESPLNRQLTVALSASGALVFFVLIWLLIEKYRRKVLKTRLEEERRSTRELSATTVSKAAEREMIRRKREGWKRVALQAVAILLDCGSCVSNWFLVSGYVRDSSEPLSSLHVAYVVIVCVKSLAFVVNTLSRSFMVRRQLAVALSITPTHALSRPDAGWVEVMEEAQQNLDGLKIEVVTFMLSSLPFAGMDMYQIAIAAQQRVATPPALLQSALLDVFTVGMAMRSMLSWVAQRSLRDQCKHRIFLMWVETKRAEQMERDKNKIKRKRVPQQEGASEPTHPDQTEAAAVCSTNHETLGSHDPISPIDVRLHLDSQHRGGQAQAIVMGSPSHSQECMSPSNIAATDTHLFPSLQRMPQARSTFRIQFRGEAGRAKVQQAQAMASDREGQTEADTQS